MGNDCASLGEALEVNVALKELSSRHDRIGPAGATGGLARTPRRYFPGSVSSIVSHARAPHTTTL